MAPIAEAFVRIRPDVDRFGPELSTGVGRQADTAGKASGKRFGVTFAKSVGGVLAGLGVARAFTGLVHGLSDSIQAASDLGETQSKVNVIFGKEGAKALATFADAAAKTYGQSKQQALDASATFGVFGKSAGLSGKALADFSTDFAGLASDMASFSNTSPEQAIDAIGAALRGESEPIRQYGVLLDDATLRQEALKLGLIKTTKEALTPQQRVLAAQAAIYKQTKDAQGDFARTSGGLANQQRILSASFADTKAKIGGVLLPAVTGVVKYLNGTALPAFAGIGDTARTLFDKVDWSGLYATAKTVVTNVASAFSDLGTQVAGYLTDVGQPIIDAMTTALRTGDYGPLGVAVGDALVRTATGAAGIARAVAAWAAGVDWLALGKSTAHVVVPFAIGLVNELAGAIIDFAIAHPLDALAFVLTIIPVGKVAGVLEKVLGRLPFVGPILRTLSSAGDKVLGAVTGGVIKPIVSALDHMAPAATGLVRRVVRSIVGVFDDIVTRLYVIGDDAIKGLGRGISNATDDVLGRVGKLIAGLIRLFRGDVLYEAGKNIIGGLVRGIASSFGAVRSKLGELTSNITKWKGPPATDRELLVPAGRSIIGGLVRGIVEATPALRKTLEGITELVQSRVETATSRLNDLRDARRSAFDSVAGSVTGGIVDALTAKDAEGNPLGANVGLNALASQASAFATVLGQLVGKVPGSVVSAIAAAGPVTGLEAARNVLSSDLGALNAAFGGIDAAARAAGRIIADVEVPPALIKAQQDQVALLTAAVAELRKPKDNGEVALRITKGGDLIVEYVNDQNRRNNRRG